MFVKRTEKGLKGGRLVVVTAVTVVVCTPDKALGQVMMFVMINHA